MRAKSQRITVKKLLFTELTEGFVKRIVTETMTVLLLAKEDTFFCHTQANKGGFYASLYYYLCRAIFNSQHEKMLKNELIK